MSVSSLWTQNFENQISKNSKNVRVSVNAVFPGDFRIYTYTDAFSFVSLHFSPNCIPAYFLLQWHQAAYGHTYRANNMSEAFNWTCPYCHKETTIVIKTNASIQVHYYDSPTKDGHMGLQTTIIACPNPACREYTISAELYPADYVDEKNFANGEFFTSKQPHITSELTDSWQLKPQSTAIPQPEYIPEQIRNDYNEACAILKLSPKASATLSRRCLQGMIRDFWTIQKDRLIDEVNELKNQGAINSSTFDTIDAIRKIGNIGAHMEKDVNLIIDIDEDEADTLIKLLENLFKDWYIDRHDREERNKEIKRIADEKQAARTVGTTP